jgi:hypothetical protein
MGSGGVCGGGANRDRRAGPKGQKRRKRLKGDSSTGQVIGDG